MDPNEWEIDAIMAEAAEEQPMSKSPETYEQGMSREFREMLEKVIDQSGSATVLEALQDICTFKAEHIRTSYGDDEQLARNWDAVAARLERAIAAAWKLPQ